MIDVYSMMPKEFQIARHEKYVTDLFIRENGNGIIVKFGEKIDIGNASEFVEPILCLAAYSDGRVINEDVPMLECRLPDGERLVGKRPEAGRGWTVTIRVPMRERLTWEDQIRFGTVTEKQAEWIQKQVDDKKTIFIIGEQNSGKTTLFNTMLGGIGSRSLVKIEKEVPEIFETENSVTYTINEHCSYKQAKSKALRESGELYALTEARTGEDMQVVIEIIGSGHQSFTTLHAGMIEDAPRRIKTLLRDAGNKSDPEEIYEDIVNDIDYFILIETCDEGKKRVTDIASLEMKGGKPVKKEVVI